MAVNLASATVDAVIPEFAKGGIVTQKTLGIIAEANTPEAIIPLNDTGSNIFESFLQKTIESSNFPYSYSQMKEFTKNIIESVESSEVNVSNNSTTNIVDSVVKSLEVMWQKIESLQAANERYDRPETDAKGKVLSMGQQQNSDSKADMARLIAMGFVGPKRF